ncbi:unnamed protein product [Rotaria socialis]|uniref:Uncharacterized protein n=1 Tax=Rotaria socialis TaxID=392032 RepID=A0A821EN03_9BILA|nr:unnamed protein product [Rotaria socialis]
MTFQFIDWLQCDNICSPYVCLCTGNGDGRYDYQETDQYDFIHVGTVASDRPIENQTMMIYEKLSDGREGHEQATLGGTICNIDR